MLDVFFSEHGTVQQYKSLFFFFILCSHFLLGLHTFLMTPLVNCHDFCIILVFRCSELRRLIRSLIAYCYSVWSFIILGWIIKALTVILMASLKKINAVLSGESNMAVQYI